MAIITLNNNSLSSVTSLPAGVGGKVLQIVSARDTTSRSTTSTSFVTASNTMSVNITPSSTSNKIYINVTANIYVASNIYSIATIFRDSTNLENQTGRGITNNYSGNGDIGTPLAMSYFDSPSTTSQITYQVYIRSWNGANTVLNENDSVGTITAYEIAG